VRRPVRHRLLLLLSDGRPNDVDEGTRDATALKTPAWQSPRPAPGGPRSSASRWTEKTPVARPDIRDGTSRCSPGRSAFPGVLTALLRDLVRGEPGNVEVLNVMRWAMRDLTRCGAEHGRRPRAQPRPRGCEVAD
jgi:hypothetical protein